jgi:hypothetical protein
MSASRASAGRAWGWLTPPQLLRNHTPVPAVSGKASVKVC